MAKIDEIKEKLNYLKVWLGITIITTIGLISWLINNFETTSNYKTIGSIFLIVILTISILLLDKSIRAKIKSLRDL